VGGAARCAQRASGHMAGWSFLKKAVSIFGFGAARAGGAAPHTTCI
jgi:hypothetical protein